MLALGTEVRPLGVPGPTRRSGGCGAERLLQLAALRGLADQSPVSSRGCLTADLFTAPGGHAWAVSANSRSRSCSSASAMTWLSVPAAVLSCKVVQGLGPTGRRERSMGDVVRWPMPGHVHLGRYLRDWAPDAHA